MCLYIIITIIVIIIIIIIKCVYLRVYDFRVSSYLIVMECAGKEVALFEELRLRQVDVFVSFCAYSVDSLNASQHDIIAIKILCQL